MGVGSIFSGRHHWWIFTKIFLGGPKVVKFVFPYSKLGKQYFLLRYLKSKGTILRPPIPTPMKETFW